MLRKLKEEGLRPLRVGKALGWETLSPRDSLRHYVKLNHTLSYNEALSQLKELIGEVHERTT